MSDPLDLSTFNFSDSETKTQVDSGAGLPMPQASQAVQPVDENLKPAPPMERLVDTTKMLPDDIEKAKTSAAQVDFNDSLTVMRHGETAMAEIAQASRNLLTNTRIGDTGDVGKIAASVIDGVKVLRLEDLRNDGSGKSVSTEKKSLFGRMMGNVVNFVAEANSAYRGFEENRKRFLDMMDEQKAKSLKKRADLMVQVQLMDEQRNAVRQSLHNLMIVIAAGQIALDRGEQECEQLRLKAVASNDPTDAANVMTFRSVLNNFRAKIAEMRETMTGSAMLLPIIEQNKNAAEVRIQQLTNGVMVVIPHLMAVASQAVVQADIGRAAAEGEKLRDANRMITEMASKGAHDAAVSAARSLAGDPRDIAMLEQVANQAIATMQEVQQIEKETAAKDIEREQKLVQIRNNLSIGMTGVMDAAIYKKEIK